MKNVLMLVMSIAVVLFFSLVSCQKKEMPKEEESVTETGGYGEESAPAVGGYGEQPAPSTGGGYGEEKAPEAGGYGGGY